MSQIRASLVTCALIALMATPPAFAGAKLKIDDESSIDFAARVQTLLIVTDKDLNDGVSKTMDYKVRRARLRVKMVVTPQVESFIQTDVGSTDGGAGQSARVIDAFVTVKPDPWFQFLMGLNMAPANRQNLTSSGGPLTIDRPGLAYKSLNWGNRMLRTFSNNTIAGTSSGLANGTAVRDLGLTLFGSGKAGEKANFKYYAGVYDGVNAAGEDTPHLAARAQLNFFDAEGGYFNSATYLGKKKTVGIGASVDMQNKVAMAGTEEVDYMYYTVDGFMEWPTSNGASFTGEAGWMMLDFSDATGYMGSQGSGFYGQAGYFVNNWQPWGEFEMWSSDAANNDVTQFRVGVTRYLKGHNANVKAGYEMTTGDGAILGMEDSVDAFVLGFFTTY
jgi:hypothetical protein